MRFLRTHARLVGVGVACAGLGAGVSAIATAGATSGRASASHHAATRFFHGGGGVRLGRAVHGQLVVSTAQGFKTVTFDRGFVQSVSGSSLTMREGTARATYKTVTLTIPAGARVRNNGRAATLATLTPGERVAVVKGPGRTRVIARSAKTP
jgi:hypothetical protein